MQLFFGIQRVFSCLRPCFQIWFSSGFLPVYVWFSSRFFAWFPACFCGFRQINVWFILVFVIGLSFSFLEHCDIVTFDPLLWWNIQREDQFWTRKGVNTRIYNVQAQQNLADVVHSITFWAMYCNKCKRVPLRSFILSHFLPSYLNRGSLPNEKNSYYSMIFLHQKIYASKLFQKFNVCFWIAKLRKPPHNFS